MTIIAGVGCRGCPVARVSRRAAYAVKSPDPLELIKIQLKCGVNPQHRESLPFLKDHLIRPHLPPLTIAVGVRAQPPALSCQLKKRPRRRFLAAEARVAASLQLRGGNLRLVTHQPAIGALEQRGGDRVSRAEEFLLRKGDGARTPSRSGAHFGHTIARRGAGTDHQPGLKLRAG